MLLIVEQLKESEAQFRSLIEQSGDAMYLSDIDGNIILVNNKACESLGYERNELLQLTIADIDVNFSTNEKMNTAWENIESNTHLTLETQHKCKDGTLRSVELSIGYYELSNKKHILGFARNITQRKEAEEELMRSQNFNQTLLNTSPDLIYVYDITEKKNIYSNAGLSKILGYTAHDIQSLGDTLISDLMHPDDFKTYLSTIIPRYQTAKDGEMIESEYRMKHKNGSWCWLQSKETIFLRHENGLPQQIFGICIDISARKNTEFEIKSHQDNLEHTVEERTESLAQSQVALLNLVDDLNDNSELLEQTNNQLKSVNQELESFSYSVSHDLRAPLRGIDGFSLALLEDYGHLLDEQGKNYLTRVRKDTQKMATLIDEMLNLSRLGRMTLQPVSVNLSEIAHAINQEFNENNPDRNVQFIVESDITCLADPTLIRAVLQNLLENAWKFTSKQAVSIIEFGKKEEDDKTVYFVKDNGAGFDMKYQKKLFTPFQRLHQESEFPGTGIGLTTVQRIIHRHNGTLWAESEVNKGATFYFSLHL